MFCGAELLASVRMQWAIDRLNVMVALAQFACPFLDCESPCCVFFISGLVYLILYLLCYAFLTRQSSTLKKYCCLLFSNTGSQWSPFFMLRFLFSGLVYLAGFVALCSIDSCFQC